jgi:uncharacterized protein
MEKLFLDVEGRPRSGWRAAIFLVAYLSLSFVLIMIALSIMAQLDLGESAASQLTFIIPFSISTLLAVGLGWLCGRFFEGVPFAALGCTPRKGWLRDLGLGAVAGTLTLALAIVPVALYGGIRFVPNTASSASSIAATLGVALAMLAAGAASEETLFRGYLLQTFDRSRLAVVGVALTSVLFALAHNANPGADPFALANTFLAGIWFAVGYLRTGALWFPFSMHLVWNWLQGPVLGINVSGLSSFAPDPIMRATDAGPAWLSGGSYGIEGGVACTVALVISIAAIQFGIRSNAEPTKDAEN